ncbi:MAG TPA: hypothetical protein VLA89_19590 [Gemmatimonadales bacterium]|nr:hypothetical protein [Gemmatimonadales bacterium]
MSRSRSDAWYQACRDSVVMGSVVSLTIPAEPYWEHLAGGVLMVIVALYPYLHYFLRRKG